MKSKYTTADHIRQISWNLKVIAEQNELLVKKLDDFTRFLEQQNKEEEISVPSIYETLKSKQILNPYEICSDYEPYNRLKKLLKQRS